MCFVVSWFSEGSVLVLAQGSARRDGVGSCLACSFGLERNKSSSPAS